MSDPSRSARGSGVAHPRVAAIIPARLGSRRLPRKVLAKETGKYLVQHVYERVAGCPGVDLVMVATDSQEVVDACRSFGARVELTSPDHASGSDRVAEVARGLDHEVIINVQGDEPLIAHADLTQLIALFPVDELRARSVPALGDVVMTTLVSPRSDLDGFLDPNIVKAVVARSGDALYFSRSPVPHDAAVASRLLLAGKAGAGDSPPVGRVEWYQHIGIYGYRRPFLLQLAGLPQSPLEKRERLEQLRVLESGYRIRVGVTRGRHLGIDTEEEYAGFVREYLTRPEETRAKRRS